MKDIVVTGGAGFIGSHLVGRLLEEGNKVRILDNLSTGKREFIEDHLDNPNFSFHEIDLLKDDFSGLLDGADQIWHMAANADVRVGAEDTKVHLDQNVMVTYRVLESMRKNRINEFLFPSTSTVYGEAKTRPTPEDYGPLKPISFYGASKLACESIISAYCGTFGMKGWIFRLANVIGPRSTHGVIHDFIMKLKKNPNELEILGDGSQKKSYIYIDDCIDAMMMLREKADQNLNIFNVGTEDWITVKRIAEIVSEEMGLKPKFVFTGGSRGWRGDVPKMMLSIKKFKDFGWTYENTSEESVIKTAKAISRS